MPSSEAPSAAAPPLTSILTSLTTSLQSALEALPQKPSYLPPPNGISLLDLKNEAMLSYLHNIVYLVLLRLRSVQGEEGVDISTCVEQLVGLRGLLEKGVKPVEGKLRYEIEKVVRRSVDAEVAAQGRRVNVKKSSGEEDEKSTDDLTHRPNVGVLTRLKNAPTANSPTKSTTNTTNTTTTATTHPSDGIYHPPRIAAVSMPNDPLSTTTSTTSTTTARLNKKSHNLDEFIASELSSAPLAEPSVGSTIVSSGRGIKTSQIRREEAERMEYEENNFVRLPKLSKKEAAQKKRRERLSGADSFGGEDWKSFAGDLDRITARAGREGGKVGQVGQVLERSRKRKEGGDGGDAGAGAGVRVGRKFSRMVNKENKKRRKV
ncbi:hypothetical protein L211DRAFT_791945 [Terfezia boudieri ATCC MYA-4762]|uniref:Localizes primarily to the nucleolus n=1 Tax=Terfezia boudieri ATCC MYA-4762 TaxID=1051890 RepID=A0A3N4LCH2_9PEZI|nr:hypothetical protein L211DRAFT_791945 [Terfezia boudieri ATCC MYA-4762]